MAWPPTGGTRRVAAPTRKIEAKVAWLRQLMEWRDQVADAEEFVESLKSDVFKEQIYVFTPAGDIIELPAGATPVDFAYRIHTEVGHQCVGAKVNDHLVPLDYKLQNGQVVKILTSRNKTGPNRDWLLSSSEYVTTASAREKIRRWFRSQERDENIAQGKEILERELRRLSVEPKPEDLLKAFPQYTKLDDLHAAIGYGAISTQRIAVKLTQQDEQDVLVPAAGIDAPRTPPRLQVMGVGDLLTILATCCRPVNGDKIIGYVTRGRGVTVHRDRLRQHRSTSPNRSASFRSHGATTARRHSRSPSRSRPGIGSGSSRMSAPSWPTSGSISSAS